MNRHFLDSSALAKRYRAEAGTDVVDRIIEDPATECLVSRLSLTELCSIFVLRMRMREIVLREFETVRDLVLADLRIGRLSLVSVQTTHFDVADQLLVTQGLQRGLRALDAIQLAIALEAHSQSPLTFVAADKKLINIAAACGLPTFDPENP